MPFLTLSYRQMRLIKLLFALLALGTFPGQIHGQAPSFGPEGVEGEVDRAQPWLIPSPVMGTPAHAMLFRPKGDGPFRLAVIAHASGQNELRRAQMPQPDYRALAGFLVARAFAVLVPERLGHGATGGSDIDDQGGCEEADHARAARATAAQIALAHEFMRGQPFIRKDGAVIIGHSAGGWGALALAHESPDIISAIIAFAPGRGHADDAPGQVCAQQALLATAALFGKSARVPVTWLVAANDSYFPPEVSRRLAYAFRSAGGKVDFRVLAADGSEGHWMPETESGITRAGAELDRALKLQPPLAAQKR
jgi:dienelactone hydrolase